MYYILSINQTGGVLRMSYLKIISAATTTILMCLWNLQFIDLFVRGVPNLDSKVIENLSKLGGLFNKIF